MSPPSLDNGGVIGGGVDDMLMVQAEVENGRSSRLICENDAGDL